MGIRNGNLDQASCKPVLQCSAAAFCFEETRVDGVGWLRVFVLESGGGMLNPLFLCNSTVGNGAPRYPLCVMQSIGLSFCPSEERGSRRGRLLTCSSVFAFASTMTTVTAVSGWCRCAVMIGVYAHTLDRPSKLDYLSARRGSVPQKGGVGNTSC